jgi:chromosomal replication initiator protein
VTGDPFETSWNRIRGELRSAVPDPIWHLWLERLGARELVGDTLVLEAEDNVRGWVTDRYGRLLQACAAAVLGPDVQVDLVAPGIPTPPADPETRQSRHHVALETFNPRLTFDQFVIGDANRLAHAAALSVAELPGLAYNPLFVCGAPGLGKTHLLHSIANYVQAYGEGMTVRYTTVEAFTNHFIGAIHNGGTEAFKAAYRDVDVLLVDDVQFLQAKAKTEEEFFHTFNAVQEAGSQLVLTSDRPPRDLEALEDRLRARFEAGLVTELGPPDHASLTRRDVSGELAAEVLAGLYPDLRAGGQPRKRTVEEIQERTCDALGVSLEALRSQSRAAGVAWARQVAMYLSRELTEETLPAIGRAFGRNHTTVMHACKRTADRIAVDREAYDVVHRLTRELAA